MEAEPAQHIIASSEQSDDGFSLISHNVSLDLRHTGKLESNKASTAAWVDSQVGVSPTGLGKSKVASTTAAS